MSPLETPVMSKLRRANAGKDQCFGSLENWGWGAHPGKGVAGLNHSRGPAMERRGQTQELCRRLKQWGWATKWIQGCTGERAATDGTAEPSVGQPKTVMQLIRIGVDLRDRICVKI